MKTRIKDYVAVIAVMVLAFAFFNGGNWPPKAYAAPGGGYSDSFNVTCGTTATLISVDNQVSYMCEVDDAATIDVAVGDVNLTTTTAPDFAAGERFGGNVKFEYCIVSTGTVDVHCRAQVTKHP